MANESGRSSGARLVIDQQGADEAIVLINKCREAFIEGITKLNSAVDKIQNTQTAVTIDRLIERYHAEYEKPIRDAVQIKVEEYCNDFDRTVKAFLNADSEAAGRI